MSAMLSGGSQNSHWGVRALDVVEAIEKADTPVQVTAYLEKAMAECGFHAYLMAGFPPPERSLYDFVVANGWSREWFDVYTRERFVAHDPIPRYCHRTTQAFEWREASYDHENDFAARRVMERARDFGMCEGLCIPIHYVDGAMAAVSIAGERIDLGGGAKPALHLIGMYAHNRMRAFAHRPRENQKRVLTPREREVLSWTANGKSSWEIGEILGIAERTVNAHIQSAAAKLNAVNRVALVVAALRNREISL
jgi:LuxR family quorum sensing-dependent transcriptional regulator